MGFYEEDDPRWAGIEQWYDYDRPGEETRVPEFVSALLILASFAAYFGLTLGGIGR